MEKLTIKDVLIKYIDRFLNPNFVNKFIYSLLILWSCLLWYQKIIDIINSFELKYDDKVIKFTTWWFGYINIFWIVLICISCYFFWRINIYTEKKLKFKTFKKASKTIKKLLDENERIFKNHWPNSSASNIDELRNENELKAWYDLRYEKVLPNNEKIFNILSNIQKIEDSEKIIVDKMKNHIEAFKKHLEDNSYDYTNHQFPIVFWYLINKYCKWWLLKDKYLYKYTVWINDYIKNNEIIITEKYLFWSVLIDKNPSDIDILIYCDYYLEKIDYDKFVSLRNDFKNTFWKWLHLSLFWKEENINFLNFKEKILDLKNF